MEDHIAIMRFAMPELEAAARRVAHRLKQTPASGIFGDDYRHKTLWGELRFEAEEGPTPELDYAWDEAILPHVRDVIAKMPEHTKALVSWHLANLEQDNPDYGVDHGLLEDAIYLATKELAGS